MNNQTVVREWSNLLTVYLQLGAISLFLMNTLIISPFSCTFEEFKNDVTTLFLEEMCKEFVTDYEFVKVNEHKSHLLMNCTDLEKLGAEMDSPFAKEWDKKNNCKDTVYSIELVA